MAANMTENSIAIGRIRDFARRGTLPHALILSGSGDRTEAARYAAAAMLCSTAESKPCLQCNACRKVLSGIHPDVLLVEDDEHKELRVEDVRDLRANIHIRPNEGARKVALFPRAEQLNERDQNVLLKIVEEGPAYAAFIFCVENSASLLATVRSRCVELKLPQEKEAAAAPDMELVQAFAENRRGRVTAYLTALENRKPKREQLQTMLQAAWRVSAEALLLQKGKAATDPALAEGAALLSRRLEPRRLAALTELFHHYALECQYNIGVGHVLGALAAEWENTI